MIFYTSNVQKKNFNTEYKLNNLLIDLLSEINQIFTRLLYFLVYNYGIYCNIKTNITVLRRCSYSKLPLITWSKYFPESQIWNYINFQKELKNLQDKQLSNKKAYDHAQLKFESYFWHISLWIIKHQYVLSFPFYNVDWFYQCIQHCSCYTQTYILIKNIILA